MRRNKTPELTIIIVSYNTREMTLACLRSIYEQTEETTFELIVVDNDSSDGSADAIANTFSELTLIHSAENLGFAAANNLAAKQAQGHYLLLLNPDTVVLDGAIDKLVAFAKRRPEAGIWGGRTVYADGSLNPGSCWAKQTAWSRTCFALGLNVLFRTEWTDPEGYGGWDRNSEREVDIVSGCFLLITHKLWQKLDGFHSDFFMYGEDADLCLRAKAVCARPRVTPAAEIIHHGGASEAVRGEAIAKVFLAKCKLLRRHWHPRFIWYGVLMLKVSALVRKQVYGFLSLYSGEQSIDDRSEAWRIVWDLRHEWASGTARALLLGKNID